MDGGSNNDDLRGGSAGAQARTPLEAIQEFQVVTNQFDAAYGGATAGVINAVSKQGTNAIRGSAFGYFTNQALTAKDFFVEQQDLEKPEAQRRQWGGTVGGPIVQDKMHFFVSFERSDLDEGRSRVYNTRPDKSFTATQQTNSYNTLGRVDHQLSNDKNYSVRVLWDHQPNYDQVLGDGTINTLYTEKDDDVTLVGAFNWITTPTQLLTMRASYVQERPDRGMPQYFEAPWSEAPPMLDFLSYYDQAGNEYADVRKMRVYGFDTLFTWFVPGRIGSHDIKSGLQYQLGEHLRDDQRYTNGSFVFPTDLDYNPADPADLSRTPDDPRAGQGAFAHAHPLHRHLHPRQVAGDVEPDAEPRPALRLAHLAVRQPLQPVLPGPRTVPGGQEQLPAAHRLRLQHGRPLGPSRRLRAVLREAVDRPVRDVSVEPRLLRLVHHQLPGQRARIRDRATGSSRPTRSWSTGLSSTGRSSTSCSRRAARRETPAMCSWTTRIASCRRSTRSASASSGSCATTCPLPPTTCIRGTGTSRSATTTIPRSAPTPAGRARSSASTSSTWRVSSAWRRSSTTSTPTRTWRRSQYDGLSLQLEKRFANAWSGRVSYSVGYARGNTSGLPTAVNDYQVVADPLLDLNDGPTNFDRRHTLSLSGRLDLPQLKGVTFSATARIMSGSPFSVYDSSFDLDQNGVLMDPLPAGTYSGAGENGITVENEGGRNGAYGPGFMQIDVRSGTGSAWG